MSDRRKPKDARVIDASEIADLFGKTKSWFYRKRRQLEEAGFPLKDTLLGGWLYSLVDAWFTARGGVGGSGPEEDPYRLAIRKATGKT